MKKRKIGILTLPLHINYGGILQAFALQTALKDLGHEAILINNDVEYQSRWLKVFDLFKQYILHYLKGKKVIWPNLASPSKRIIIGRNTSSFVNSYIKKTHLIKPVISCDDIDRYKFDSFIVGSDQVWRPSYAPSILNYFFDFVPEQRKSIKISYAASFGVDHWQYDDFETKSCKILASQFQAISVREVSGIKLCNDYLGIAADQVIDPTMLLSKNRYVELVEKANLNIPKEKLYTYILDKSEENLKIEDKVCSILGLSAFTVMPRKDTENLKNSNLEEFVFPPVEEWIQGFMLADYVITDSFHGTLFSIIFNKQFISIGNTNRGLSRFTSILGEMDLQSRLVLSVNDVTPSLMKARIDYDLVNSKVSQARKNAIDYLKKNLA